MDHVSAGRPTIEQVAALAGVSRGTASRVINNEPYVSAAARSAVLKAVRQLGYVPNQAARSLVTRTHETVALVVSGDDLDLCDDPFFAEVILGINTVLSDTDLEMMLLLGAAGKARERLRRRLKSGQLDGVMLLALQGADPLCQLVKQSGAPTVYGGRTLSGGDPPYFVDADNRGGARTAMEHLISCGRKRIGIITGPMAKEVSRARLNGCLDAIDGDQPLIETSDFLESGGAQAMERLLEADPELDAVFAHSDTMAAGALRTLRRLGRRVPDDVAVVGFDDLPWARHTAPPLTTVNQPIRALGAEMARMLIALIGGNKPSSLVLPTRLVVRSST